MVEIPIGPGPIAAIVFILFEIILLPILMDSTTKASSLLIQHYGLKDETILIRSIPFAPWSDGLLCHRSPTQVLLLVIRMFCIVIPVYLETKLVYIQRPSPVQLRHAFVPKSSSERINFDNITHSRGSRLASELCTYVDEHGWLVARIANSSRATVSGSLEFKYMQCMQSTEKRLLRVCNIGISKDNNWIVTEDLKVSGITPGLQSRDIHGFLGTTCIRNGNTLIRDFQVTCLQGTIENGELIVMCHHIAGLTAHVFVISAPITYETNHSNTYFIESLENLFLPRAEFRLRIPQSDVKFKYSNLGIRLEFQEAVLLDSRDFNRTIRKHFINYLSIPQTDGFIEKEASKIDFLKSLSHDSLYLYESNYTVTSPMQNLKSYTIVEKQIIAISAVEVVCILIFGICINVLFAIKIHSCPPNTFKGVSTAWENANCSGY